MSQTRWWLLALAIGVGVTALRPAAVLADEPVRKVTVSAKSQIAVVPDEVLLTFYIETENKDLIQAKAENDKLTRAILALGPKHGIPTEQFTMTSLAMGPKYTQRGPDRETVMVGYEVGRTIEVAVRDFTKLEPMLADALDAGVTRVGELLFRTRKHQDYQVEARQKAVEYARQKAVHLAELNGLVLGQALEIEEGTEENEHAWGMACVAPSAAATPGGPSPYRLVAEEPKPKTPPAEGGDRVLAPGTVTIYATVTITFEMRKRSG